MVKGISRRVVVLDAPDQRFFEQAIFIVRNGAGEGVTSRQLVEEARRVAHDYAAGNSGRTAGRWRNFAPAVYALLGAGTIGAAWLITALL